MEETTVASARPVRAWIFFITANRQTAAHRISRPYKSSWLFRQAIRWPRAIKPISTVITTILLLAFAPFATAQDADATTKAFAPTLPDSSGQTNSYPTWDGLDSGR